MRALVFFCFLLGLIPSIFINPYIGVLLYSWISFMSPHRLVWGFVTEIPLALVTAIATLIAWLASNEPKRLRFDATVWLILAFAVVITVTTMLALNPKAAFIFWDRTIKELLFVLVTIALTTNRIRFHALLWVMAVSIGYFGLKGGAFSLLHGGDFQVYGPPDSAIYDNNDIGAGLVVALPLMNYVRISSAHKWVRRGWLFAMANCLLAIIATYSRGAMLGLIAVSIFLWLKSKRKLVAGLVIPLAVIAAIAFMPQKYMERIDTIVHYQQDESAMHRIQIWGVALQIAVHRPLIGGGFAATFSQAVVNRYNPRAVWRAVHNIFIGVLCEQGFIGFAIWLGLLFVGWRNSRQIQRLSRDRPEWQWANDFARMSQVSLVAYCVVGSFGNYAYWDYYYTILGLLAAARTMMERAMQAQPSALTLAAAPHPGPPLLAYHRLRDR